MVAFYNGVFGSGLTPVEGFEPYAGQLTQLHLLLCPAQVAGITATDNRHQLRLEVDDLAAFGLAAFGARVRQAKGQVLGDAWQQGSRRGLAIRDPDGSSLELLQSREP